MNSEDLVEDHEASRCFIRGLPDIELLKLVGKLAADFFIRKGGDTDSETVLAESVGAEAGIARAVLDRQ